MIPMKLFLRFDRAAREYGIRGALHPEVRRQVIKDYKRLKTKIVNLILQEG